MTLFGDALRKIRNDRGMSQEDLAEILGTTKQVISRYETHQRTPKVTVVAEYANKLGVPINVLTGESDYRPAEFGRPNNSDELFATIYSHLGDEAADIISCYLSFSPSNRRLLSAIAKAIQQEQDTPASPVP